MFVKKIKLCDFKSNSDKFAIRIRIKDEFNNIVSFDDESFVKIVKTETMSSRKYENLYNLIRTDINPDIYSPKLSNYVYMSNNFSEVIEIEFKEVISISSLLINLSPVDETICQPTKCTVQVSNMETNKTFKVTPEGDFSNCIHTIDLKSNIVIDDLIYEIVEFTNYSRIIAFLKTLFNSEVYFIYNDEFLSVNDLVKIEDIFNKTFIFTDKIKNKYIKFNKGGI